MTSLNDNIAASTNPSDLIFGLTTEGVNNLATKCIEAKSGAYCPYSRFRVGASLLLSPSFLQKAQSSSATRSPNIVTGANIENAAYPVGTCAERVAIGTAVAQYGVSYGDIIAIGVSTDLDEACSPCGMCRQFIREFCPDEVPVFMFWGKAEAGDVKSYKSFQVKTVGELLPLSFGPSKLLRSAELEEAGKQAKD